MEDPHVILKRGDYGGESMASSIDENENSRTRKRPARSDIMSE
jgi:hypothetical protein